MHGNQPFENKSVVGYGEINKKYGIGRSKRNTA